MNGYRVVRLGPDDGGRFRAMNRLFARVFEDAESYAGAPPDDGYVRRLLARDHVIMLVAEADGTVVGGLVAHDLPKHEQARSEVYIYDLAVDDAHRRRGIATALIADVRRIAAATGGWAVYVQADYGDAPAIALYTKLGVREDVMHFDIAPGDGEIPPA